MNTEKHIYVCMIEFTGYLFKIEPHRSGAFKFKSQWISKLQNIHSYIWGPKVAALMITMMRMISVSTIDRKDTW